MKQFRTGLVMFTLLFTLLIIGKNGNTSAQASRKQSPAKTLLIFEKKQCFGFCPVYRAEFKTDGNVLVTAQPPAKPKVQRTFRISRKEAQELWKRGEQLGFFQLKDNYESLIPDYPAREITLYKNNKPKKVTYTEGGPQALDAYLNDLAQLVEKNLDVNFGPPKEE
ncbi:hypothetical protein I5M27_17295 [Adhaeribacter sp. BT258]|uniref:DUF6438 domain-containing protein n=1 Tax=Adhaeribacter terrigena TaxID=2793070 RepID=A0ABS1C610_9BACT|nr:DUF6438 domain-containing protein [Adhaeribacter terrigena]MBK0404753.1 hypothetical protein [Adhaeribacter terrigena]